MINFFAPINDLGYGVFSHNLIRAFDEHVRKDVALFPMPLTPDFSDATIERWIENGKQFRRSDPSIMIFQGPWLNRFCGSPMIGLPIFELDEVPEYDLQLFKTLDAMFQPSEWGKKILQQHGVEKVHVVPGGFDPAIYYPEMKLDQKMARIQRQGISFVHVGKWEPRKSSEEILRCFIRATAAPDVRANLLFHVCNPFDPKWFEPIQRLLIQQGFTQSDMHFIRGETRILVPQERFKADTRKLYQMAEFGIWASKAEGWNLPLLECLACGIPCLTTRNTAHADYLSPEIYPTELILSTNKTEPTREGGVWWRIDEAELTRKIQDILADPLKHLLLEPACTASVKDFSWKNAAFRLRDALAAVGVL